MSIYGIAGVILAAFYVGFGTGYTPGTAAPRRLRGLPAMVIGATIAFLLWQFAKGTARDPYSAASMFMFIAVFAVIFLFGAGRFFGSLIPLLVEDGARRRQATALALAAPLVMVVSLFYPLEMKRLEREAANAVALSELQSGTYVATFGTHLVTLPGVPAVEVHHTCTLGHSSCRTMFWHSPGLNNAESDGLKITRLSIVTHDEALRATEEWCRTRPDQAGSVWCRITSDDALTFWPAAEIDGSGLDTPLQCSESKKDGVTCQARHDVAPGISAMLHGKGTTRTGAEAANLAKQATAEAVWAALTRP